MAPLLIGLFIFTAANAVGPASGGSFNPARSLDPAIYNVDLGDMWIYIFAPLLGGMIGGAIRIYFGPAPAHEAATIRATGGLPSRGGGAADRRRHSLQRLTRPARQRAPPAGRARRHRGGAASRRRPTARGARELRGRSSGHDS